MNLSVPIINPSNRLLLRKVGCNLIDSEGNAFPIIRGVPRISAIENYTLNFGMQWNKFDKIQLDRDQGYKGSSIRFYAETRWKPEDLYQKDILEVGSGAGRFSKVVLESTEATLYSIDYSDAVTANYRNNNDIAASRFHLFQASVYDMPFPDNSFDKVFCLGVLQHTPSFSEAVRCLASKVKPGGELVVDFYPIRGWWTKVHAKYILRPLTKRMNHEKLLALIERNVDWLISLHYMLYKIKLGFLTRFLPLCNVVESIPQDLDKSKIREWAILDTFDQYAPEYDCPQKISTVVEFFQDSGMQVTFAGYEQFEGGKSSVVRGTKIATD